ncbi:unnamed protein product [Ectocarpus sp. 12 AP-2014]
MTTAGRWAARAAAAVTIALLRCGGAPPCHAFLASGSMAFAPQHSCRESRYCRATSMSAADGLDLSNTAVAEVDDDGSGATSRSNVAAAAAGSTHGNTGGATEKKQRNSGGAAAKAGRRWIKELKTGDKVIGYVADTTKFAAFVDCSVVRQGSKNKIVPVTGFLHLTDIKRPYALEGTPGAKDCEVEVKKGIHLTAYVKDVFPNAGRMTLSLDPNINKDKVLKLRDSKRQRSRNSRRERLHKKGRRHAVGDIVEGFVREVHESMLLVDVMFAQLSVLRASKIRNSGEGEKFVNLSKITKPGDLITVRIEDIETSKRRGAKDDKATIDFVAWGGLGAAKDENHLEGDDSSPAAAVAGQEFDIAAEIDALPAQQQTDAESAGPEADVTMQQHR